MPVYVFQINQSEQWSGIIIEKNFRSYDDVDMRGICCLWSIHYGISTYLRADFVVYCIFKRVYPRNNTGR